jgi:hypothetical protein
VFYLNYEGIQHYTLSQVYPSKENYSTAIAAVDIKKQRINNNSSNTLLLNEEEKSLETEIIYIIDREELYLEPKFNVEYLASRLGKSRHHISKLEIRIKLSPPTIIKLKKFLSF